ncbi:MAG: glycosyltransferase family 4 protein [Polaribacter sp.]
MKIGFDAKRIFHNATGLGNYGRDLVRILLEFYPDNQYVLYNPKPKKKKCLQNRKNVVEVLPKSKFWKLFSSLWRQTSIVKQLQEDNVEIYHGLSAEIPVGFKSSNIKTVVTVHDLIFVRYPKLYSFIDVKIQLKKVRHAVKYADKIIAISTQTKRDIVEFLKVDGKNIDVIYQGCHHSFKEVKSEKFKTEIIKKYNLPAKFVLNVGTINERKNVLTLVKAISNIDIQLVIVGKKTSYYNKVDQYICANNLQEKVHFLEKLNLKELSALYQLAEIFVYPSIFEGFGIPIIEALYSKTPVITSTGSCFSEAGGPNSIYVNPYDYKNLEKQLLYLLENEERRIEIIEKGFDFVQKFNDKNIADSYMNVYKSIVN